MHDIDFPVKYAGVQRPHLRIQSTRMHGTNTFFFFDNPLFLDVHNIVEKICHYFLFIATENTDSASDSFTYMTKS